MKGQTAGPLRAEKTIMQSLLVSFSLQTISSSRLQYSFQGSKQMTERQQTLRTHGERRNVFATPDSPKTSTKSVDPRTILIICHFYISILIIYV